jgi:hypothetical protein
MQALQQFLSKFAMDVVRTALASAICALLFAHQWTQSTPSTASQATTGTASVAGEQAVRMIRDEHDLVAEYLKAEHAKERAVIEKEVREANAAKQAVQAAVRQPDVEARKIAPTAQRPIQQRLASVDSVPAGSGAALPASVTPAPASVAPAAVAPAAVAPVAAVNTPVNPAAVAPLPPPVVLAPPEVAAPSRVEAPRESFGQKVATATHVNDVVSFVRDVSGWFKHEEAPVPPADVRFPLVNAEM